MAIDCFHPAVDGWFNKTFAAPTQVQLEAWSAIKSGSHTLIAAPTGSGKTLAAFLAAIDDLVWLGLKGDLLGQLLDQTLILYVSPLKALSNDIQKNLEIPLTGIRDELLELGCKEIAIRTMVRTGDTPPVDRERMRRKPPHILVTTPESLYILLTSDSGRRVLSTVRVLIVDEIHALAGNKRGAHLALSIERLQALCETPLTRVGLSATLKSMETMARFLTGREHHNCTLIDSGHGRDRDLAIKVTDLPLQAVMSAEAWQTVYEELIALIENHRTTLIFVNTRRLAERIAKALSERIGEQAVTPHHGSLAREHRLEAEKRLKLGQLRALVATASLELGIDIGDVDLVCQIGSPRAISTFLQRVGRSGHAILGKPKGRLFPTTRDELVECVALLEAINREELEHLVLPAQPLDVLAQQLVAEVSCRQWEVEALFDLVRRCWSYRTLVRDKFDAVVAMLAEGFSTQRGRRSAWLHHDAVNGRLRARRGARLTAVLNGGAIPDLFDYEVILQPEGLFIGALNEDFAFESLPGDIFQLGNTSYRMLKIERGRVFVEDAHGQPPNIPFWFGEAPGRSDELSLAVSRLRKEIESRLQETDPVATCDWLKTQLGTPTAVTLQLVDYLAAAHAALGVIPNCDTLVFERFFDQAGDQHLVIHAPFGSRLNRAWGLALRKRFCRKFNFELQAAAMEDNIVLSMGSTHSFPLEEVAAYLKSTTVRDILIQALLDAPLFATHWRWNANIALAVRRNRNGKRIPPQLQRMDAEDLLAVTFPDQLACLENITGNRTIPDHPLVQQTLDDCLNLAMDINGLESLLRRIESGQVRVLTRDLVGPSPLAQEILTARPFAFLDNAPAEERRTQMVQAQRFMSPQDATELGRLSPEAIALVQAQAWPQVNNADELHDALMLLGFVTEQEGTQGSTGTWKVFMGQLIHENRATVFTPASELMNEVYRFSSATDALAGGCIGKAKSTRTFWVCAERLAPVLVLYPSGTLQPQITPVDKGIAWTRELALLELVRARLEGVGPISAASLASLFGVTVSEIHTALTALETEGFVMRGQFTSKAQVTEWCERGLLARIHRYTLRHLRKQIQAVSRVNFMRFLLHWHGLENSDECCPTLDLAEGVEALAKVIEQLEGFEIPAAAWEGEILSVRLKNYLPVWLDQLCAAGRVRWVRLKPPAASNSLVQPNVLLPKTAVTYADANQLRKIRVAGSLRNTPLALVGREALSDWCAQVVPQKYELSSSACCVLESLDRNGASFFDELLGDTNLLQSQAEAALAELAACGLVSSDSFKGLRALLVPSYRRKRRHGPRRRVVPAVGVHDAGRWFRVHRPPRLDQTAEQPSEKRTVEQKAQVFLRRYGIVFSALLERETGLPPWRELLYVYRRFEARGIIRGGRFVEGIAGEQFALPEALALLRELSRKNNNGRLIAVSAVDPLNLVGIVLPGRRVPALAGNRIVYRDGAVLALWVSGKLQPLSKVDSGLVCAIRDALFQRKQPRMNSTNQMRLRFRANLRRYPF